MEDGRETNRLRLQPVSNLHGLGLIHLVRSIRVEQGFRAPWFRPRAFTHLDLRHFSTLANVHTLKLQYLDIDLFVPTLEHHFGHFSQTLRSITLYDPWCTPRQLSHFLSLFSNLDNIGIRNTCTPSLTTSTADMKLVPFSALKPRGRLALHNVSWVEAWTHLITSSSDLRFRHMFLYAARSCAPILFKACAETLETLQLGGVDDSE